MSPHGADTPNHPRRPRNPIPVSVTWTIISAALALGLVATLIFSFAREQAAITIGMLGVVAAASFGAAGLVGFLFGVPRRATAEASQPSLAYVPNTNLEQVSDWLTKLLLGATLTQITNLNQYFSELFSTVGDTIGGGAATPFVGALTAYYASAGFISGWIATRLNLGRLMVEADERMRRLLEVANEVEATGNIELADEIRTAASTAAGRSAPPSWHSLADEYEIIRSTQPSGVSRTRRMSDLFRSGKAEAVSAGEALNKTAVVALFQVGTEGARIAAISYMAARIDLVDLDSVIEAIRAPKSAYEQYHALKIALEYLSGPDPLNEGNRSALAQAVDELLSTGKLDQALDRRSLAVAIRDLASPH